MSISTYWCGHCESNKRGNFRKNCSKPKCIKNSIKYKGPRKVGVCPVCYKCCEGIEGEVTLLPISKQHFYNVNYHDNDIYDTLEIGNDVTSLQISIFIGESNLILEKMMGTQN